MSSAHERLELWELQWWGWVERISAGRWFREGQLPAGAAAGTSVSLHCPLVDGMSLASRQLEGEFELIVVTMGGFGET